MQVKRIPRLSSVSLKKQQGFIQNLIIPGLILLGIVIGAFALMSNSSPGGADKEQAAVHAAQILAQGISLKEAIQRATADGIPAASIAADLKATLVTPGYVAGSLPSAPAGSQGTATSWAFSTNTIVLTDNDATPLDLGTAAKDDVLLLDKLTKEVCIRLNNKLYGETILKDLDTDIGTKAGAAAIAAPTIGTSPSATQLKKGTPEGCVPSAVSGYTYYKLVKAI